MIIIKLYSILSKTVRGKMKIKYFKVLPLPGKLSYNLYQIFLNVNNGLTLLIIRELQTKITIRYHFTSIRMAITKKTKTKKTHNPENNKIW